LRKRLAYGENRVNCGALLVGEHVHEGGRRKFVESGGAGIDVFGLR
jgi:hypothetical protein